PRLEEAAEHQGYWYHESLGVETFFSRLCCLPPPVLSPRPLAKTGRKTVIRARTHLFRRRAVHRVLIPLESRPKLVRRIASVQMTKTEVAGLKAECCPSFRGQQIQSVPQRIPLC